MNQLQPRTRLRKLAGRAAVASFVILAVNDAFAGVFEAHNSMLPKAQKYPNPFNYLIFPLFLVSVGLAVTYVLFVALCKRSSP